MSRNPAYVFPALLLALWVGGASASPAERLGQAVRFKTISYQDQDQIDYAEFERIPAVPAGVLSTGFQ